MKLAFSDKVGNCYCCLCDWHRNYATIEETEKSIRNHLELWHNRLLVSFTEKGGGVNYNEQDSSGNYKKELPSRIYTGNADKVRWDKSKRPF